MSLSVFMAIEVKDTKTNKWEKVELLVPNFDKFDKSERIPADFSYPNGCHDIFCMLGYENGIDYDTTCELSYGLPFDVSDSVKAEYADWSGEDMDNIRPTVVNLADLHVEVLMHPRVPDYSSDDSNATMENPLTDVYRRAVAWVDIYMNRSYDTWKESDVRIIGWVA